MKASGKIVVLCMACGNARLDSGEVQCLCTPEVHSIVYLWLVDDNSPLTANAYLTYVLDIFFQNILAKFGAQYKLSFFFFLSSIVLLFTLLFTLEIHLSPEKEVMATRKYVKMAMYKV